MFLMGDNWKKACRGNVVSVRAWQSGLNPVCQCHRTAYYLNSPRRWHFYSFYFINATQTTIGCDNQLWLGDTPPIVRTGPISLIICGVCSALWKAGGGRSTLTAPQGLWLLGPAPPPPCQLLSSANLPLLASGVRALLFSPPLFLHPDLLFGGRQCTAFRPGLSSLFEKQQEIPGRPQACRNIWEAKWLGWDLALLSADI